MKQIELERQNFKVNNPDKNKLEPGLKIEIVRDKFSEDSEQCSSSTSHVQKHHNIPKVKLSLKGKKKFNHVTKTLTNSLSLVSPHSKVAATANTCSSSLSPSSQIY